MFYKNVLFVFLMLFLPTINAAIVTVDFSGKTNTSAGVASDLQSLIPIGQTFSGSYTYNTATPGLLNTTGVSYLGAISDFTVNFGSLYAKLDNGHMLLINDAEVPPLPNETEPSFLDTYLIQVSTGSTLWPIAVDTNIVLSDLVTDTLVSGFSLSEIRMSVEDPSGSMLSSAILTNAAPDISGLPMVFNFKFGLDCCTGSTEVGGIVDTLSVSAVPIPSSILLFVSGFISMVSVVRYKNKGSCK